MQKSKRSVGKLLFHGEDDWKTRHWERMWGELLRKELYCGFYLARERQYLFPTSGWWRGLRITQKPWHSFGMGVGLFVWSPFKRCPFQKDFLSEWGDSRGRGCGVYWQEQKLKGDEVQPVEKEAVPPSKELEFKSTAKESLKKLGKHVSEKEF